MNPDAKIYIAGHRGLVGSALMRNLQAKGYTNAAGLPAPAFENAQGGFRIFFKPRPEALSGGVNGGVNGGVFENPIHLLELIKRRPGINTRQMVAVAGKSQRTLERWIRQLKNQGRIEFQGTPKTGGYHPTGDSA